MTDVLVQTGRDLCESKGCHEVQSFGFDVGLEPSQQETSPVSWKDFLERLVKIW